MKNLLVFVVFVFLSGLSSAAQNLNEISGFWKLYVMETYDSISGTFIPWNGGMQGYLLYSENGYMSLHLTLPDYEKSELEVTNFNPNQSLEVLKYLTASYYYMAEYEIDTNLKQVRHQRLSHSNPNDWGKTVYRNYHFSGDTLILQPAEAGLAGYRLKWLPY